jgi:hypothetical protein
MRIRASTERRILATDAACAGTNTLVPSRPSWKLIDELLDRGYSKAQIAQWLGYKTRAIQIKRGGLMTAGLASRVERMYRLVESGRLRRA